jgi:hypothetical protein
VDGFGEDFKCVTFRGCDGEQPSRIVIAGDQEDAAIRQYLADSNRCVDSVHAIHHHICNEVVKGALLREFEAALTTVYGSSFEAADVENHRECVCIGGIVIYDKDRGPDGFHVLTWGGRIAIQAAMILTDKLRRRMSGTAPRGKSVVDET